MGRITRLLGRTAKNDAQSESLPRLTGNPLKQADGGYRVEIDSEYYLNTRRVGGNVSVFHGTRLLFTERGGTPNDAQVSSNGITMICYGPRGASLATIVKFFDRLGKSKGQIRFNALSYSSGISGDGKVAVVQFCNSDGKDGGALAIIEVDQLKIIGRLFLEGGWAESYKIFPDERVIEARYSTGRTYRYAFDSTFIDKERFRNDQIEYGDPTVLVQIVLREFESSVSLNHDQHAEMLGILDRADARGISKYSDWHAVALRARGEILESEGRVVVSENLINCHKNQ
jgi:hypothetical protein